MKIFRSMLECSIPFILYFLIFFLLCIFIGNKAAIIIVTILLFIIAILFLKNEDFYEKYINLLFDRETYEKYINDIYSMTDYSVEQMKEKKRHDSSINYILLAIITILNLLRNPTGKSTLNIEVIKIISKLIALLLNSIIGMYFYRKFKNSKQYIFSCFFMTVILLLSLIKSKEYIFPYILIAIASIPCCKINNYHR